MANFGERLKLLREEKQITQKDLAKILSLANSTVSQYESNKRDPDSTTLQKLADYFNVTLDFLLGRSDFRHYPEVITAHPLGDPMDDLPEEALKELETLRQYVINKYQKKPQD